MIAETNTTKVLIVEDDESWQGIWKEVFEDEGYEVVQIGYSQNAISELAGQTYALIIVDLSLPESSHELELSFEHGMDVINQALALDLNPNRIWAITGYEELPVEVGRRLGQCSVNVAVKSPEAVGIVLAAVRQQVRPRSTDIVMKFGGTSMGSVDSISAVAKIIAEYVQENSVPCTVVVSAMNKVTDSLLACALDAEARDLVPVQERLEELRTTHAAAASALITRADLRQAYLVYLGDVHESLLRMYQGIAALAELSPRSSDRIVGYGERLSAHLLAAALQSQGVKSVAVDATALIITDDVFGSASPLMDETTQKVKSACASA